MFSLSSLLPIDRQRSTRDAGLWSIHAARGQPQLGKEQRYINKRIRIILVLGNQILLHVQDSSCGNGVLGGLTKTIDRQL